MGTSSATIRFGNFQKKKNFGFKSARQNLTDRSDFSSDGVILYAKPRF